MADAEGHFSEDDISALQMSLNDWYTVDILTVWTPAASNAVNASLADPSSEALYADANEKLIVATADLLNWYGNHQALGLEPAFDAETTERALVLLMQQLVDRNLQVFDGTATSGGLAPLYEAFSWTLTIQLMLDLNPNLTAVPEIASGPTTIADVLQMGGVEIEFIGEGATLTGTMSPSKSISRRSLRRLINRMDSSARKAA